MDAVTKAMKEQRLFLVTEDMLKDLIRSQSKDLYQAKGRGLMTYEQAREVFQLSEAGFKKLLNDPNTLLQKSSIKGRLKAESVFNEVERLCNPADL
ncbi:hypothetical protein GCM10011318_00110 [Phaeocystidibacter marisrubri]|nr:hypothetical protein GCM10011318_00110 [Phaeocystidibacter marisrubri]